MTRGFSRTKAVHLATCLLLGGCSGGIGGWFGGSDRATLEPADGYPVVVTDTRVLVARVTSIRREATPGGVIIHAEGTARSPGYWDPDLVRVTTDESEAEDGERVYEFRVRPPVTPPPAASPSASQIDAAAFASDRALDGVRRITVVASENSQAFRR